MQSGSDNVLRRMKRRYSRAQALEVIEKIRKMIPDANFTTDLMVGFPGETEEDFLETVSFVREARLLDAHVFAYSKRDGTPAADYEDQIPEDIKRARSDRLIRVKNEVRDSVLDEKITSGEPLVAIAETYSKEKKYTAHTASFIEVEFFSDKPDLSGEVVKLRPVSRKNGVIYCELI